MSADRSKDRHRHQRYTIDLGDDGELMAELSELLTPAERKKLCRLFVLAFLKKPGARIPRLKDYEHGGS